MIWELLCDFESGEILSLETIFPGIQVFLCDFPREQPWYLWSVCLIFACLKGSVNIETE